jgi:antitoxin MazE
MTITYIRKWGNSLGLRIPRTMLEQLKVAENETVEVKVDGGSLIVTPVRHAYTLEELLAGITPENLHAAVDTGPSVGNEEW